jgi:hypothetical protein
MFTTFRRWLLKIIPALRYSVRAQQKPQSRSRRPRVDALEERLVCDVDFGDAINPHLANHPINPGLDAILYTPLGAGDRLAPGVTGHFHPHLTININGKPAVIPAGVGLGVIINGVQGDMPLHTHGTDGIIHVESLVPFTWHLRDFMAVWGQTLSSTDVLGHHADAKHKITMTVNGLPSKEFGNLALKPGQEIVINYGSASTAPHHPTHHPTHTPTHHPKHKK